MDAKKIIAKVTGLMKSNNFDEAIPLLQDLLKSEPQHELALGLLASIYAEIQMTDKAIDLYQQLLSINPNNPLARLQLGMLFYANNQFDEAIEIWLASLTDEKNFVLHYYTGMAYLQKQQPEHASAMFEKARHYMPDTHALYPDLMLQMSDKQNLH